jgi:hypothetical protein
MQESSTYANPIYSAETSTCVLYYVTLTAVALKQVCHVRFVESLLLL